ncbi:MAG: AMP-dependent synthetase/ligase [Chitinophagaceae bacterium]|jgi:long-chain acyl-CoA synthetase
MRPTRLFDCLDWQLQRSPQEDMFAAKENGHWRKYSTQEVRKLVDSLSMGLLHAGVGYQDGSVEGRDKIAVLSNNRPEWLILDLAIQQTGAILTPIYPTISPNELEFIFNDASIKMVFVSDQELYNKVQSVRSKTPSVQAVYSFNELSGVLNWKELLHNGTASDLEKLQSIKDAIRPDELATILYTSGTTGFPKGVMLSHQNIMENVQNVEEIVSAVANASDRCLSFLPLNHIFERMVSYIYMYIGVSIYYAESIDTVGDNLKEVKPTLFTTVPRLLEKVYEKIMAKGRELTGVKKNLFFWAVGVANKFELDKNQGFVYNIQLAIANKLIFSKWRDALGGNVKAIVTGAAACQVRLLRIFTAAKIVVMEGYGLTETSPVISVNRFDPSGRRFGTVGQGIKNVEVKLAEDGEICCRGSNVMMGYYKRPDLTAECIDNENWFHTGDIGTWVEGNFLKITDRKKEIFKTSGGKYVAPQPIENKMKESPFIEQMMVVGPERKFTAALIVPAFANLKTWCEKNGVPHQSNDEMISSPRVQEHYKSIVEKFNVQFNHIEQVKKFELLNAEWTIDGGELTPTLKLKRKVITEKYSDAIERIYAEDEKY